MVSQSKSQGTVGNSEVSAFERRLAQFAPIFLWNDIDVISIAIPIYGHAVAGLVVARSACVTVPAVAARRPCGGLPSPLTLNNGAARAATS